MRLWMGCTWEDTMKRCNSISNSQRLCWVTKKSILNHTESMLWCIQTIRWLNQVRASLGNCITDLETRKWIHINVDFAYFFGRLVTELALSKPLGRLV
jgi:hypothetical protein